MYDIFISYSSKDQIIADAIVNILESRKIKCWIAYRDAGIGADYAESITKAIKNCKVCVFVFSGESNKSKHVLNEINLCFDENKMIIPFRIENIKMGDALTYYLSKTHWLDALSKPIENHIQNLADKLIALINNNSKPQPIKPANNGSMQSYQQNITTQPLSDNRLTKQLESKKSLKNLWFTIIVTVLFSTCCGLLLGCFLFYSISEIKSENSLTLPSMIPTITFYLILLALSVSLYGISYFSLPEKLRSSLDENKYRKIVHFSNFVLVIGMSIYFIFKSI